MSSNSNSFGENSNSFGENSNSFGEISNSFGWKLLGVRLGGSPRRQGPGPAQVHARHNYAL